MDKSEAIANQCPNQGEPAVYQARVLLNLMNDTIEYNDAETCFQSGYYRWQLNNQAAEKEEQPVRVIPNPAKHEIIIRLNGISDGICYVRITEAIGKNVMHSSFDCKNRQQKINIQKLLPGIYHIEIKVNDSLMLHVKQVSVR